MDGGMLLSGETVEAGPRGSDQLWGANRVDRRNLAARCGCTHSHLRDDFELLLRCCLARFPKLAPNLKRASVITLV